MIDISKELNDTLKEKAGREGFIENKAYRQFRDILKNFFVQLAADYFRDGNAAGPKADVWAKKREERKSHYRALERRDKQAKVRKEKFQSSLNSFFEHLAENKYEEDINQLLEEIERKL